MKNTKEFQYPNESRKQELDKMIADFSDKGCLFVEDLFDEFCYCLRHDDDRSNDILAVTFEDEFGNELTFDLSREEILYVVSAITEKLDAMTYDGTGGGFGDEG